MYCENKKQPLELAPNNLLEKNNELLYTCMPLPAQHECWFEL